MIHRTQDKIVCIFFVNNSRKYLDHYIFFNSYNYYTYNAQKSKGLMSFKHCYKNDKN